MRSLAAAKDGTVIAVYAGTHTRDFVLAKSGTASQPITVRSDAGGMSLVHGTIVK